MPDSNGVLGAFGRDHPWFRTDETSCRRFSRDRSIYRVVPAAVAEPRDEDDLLALIAFAKNEGVVLIPRGGGTNTGGSALGRGVVVHFAANGHWDALERLDDRRIRCGPAVRHDAAQRLMRSFGMYLPSDPSSGPISTIGGNVATKASGPHALKHGAVDRYVDSLTLVTAGGDRVRAHKESTVPSVCRQAMSRAEKAVRANRRVFESVTRKGRMKCASAYNFQAMLEADSAGAKLAQLVVGSAGTLGFVTEVVLRGEPVEPGRSSALLFFHSARAACDAIERILEAGPDAVEIMDPEALGVVVERHPELSLPAGSNAMLMVEFLGAGSHARSEQLVGDLSAGAWSLSAPPLIRDDDSQADALWSVRKQLFPTLRRLEKDLRAYSIVNDVGVPVVRIGALLSGAQAVFRDLGLRAPIYGHAGSGNLHLRPLFDRRDDALETKVRETAERIYRLVTDLGGTTTAEHGMGRLRAHFLELEWGEYLVTVMRELKTDFDPDGILNPDVLSPPGDLLDCAVFD